ncbi:hypothetical protein NE237_010395 [Protea cynaroides]|uniref:Uncharacterized protein n=1 Tax=Protea cynaroides TaxID=273540 RepID=A0A9Q0R165_9MAGN|nr:hypothetical protein NE237_010395 [Protea cynaroides]
MSEPVLPRRRPAKVGNTNFELLTVDSKYKELKVANDAQEATMERMAAECTGLLQELSVAQGKAKGAEGELTREQHKLQKEEGELRQAKEKLCKAEDEAEDLCGIIVKELEGGGEDRSPYLPMFWAPPPTPLVEEGVGDVLMEQTTVQATQQTQDPSTSDGDALIAMTVDPHPQRTLFLWLREVFSPFFVPTSGGFLSLAPCELVKI